MQEIPQSLGMYYYCKLQETAVFLIVEFRLQCTLVNLGTRNSEQQIKFFCNSDVNVNPWLCTLSSII